LRRDSADEKESLVIVQYQIARTIEKLLPSYTDFLSQLVKIKSEYGFEKEAQQLVRQKMETIGLQPSMFYSRDDVEAVNLVATISGTNKYYKKSLILNAHCDVTPVDDISRWTRHPYSGEIINNILYGRGAQDDKAGVAIILLIAEVITTLNLNLGGDLLIQSVIEDETTGNGSKTLIDNGYKADGVIIVDGTWSERIIYAHLGQLWINIEISGDPVAACVESRGVNPIYLGMEYIKKAKGLITELNKKATEFEKIAEPYFVNTGSFHSGAWHGSVPSIALLQMQVGFPEQHTPQTMMSLLEDLGRCTSERIKIQQDILATPAFRTDPKNSLITKLKDVIHHNSRKEVLTVPITGHCDMRHFPTSNICLYGPGAGKNAHGIDECYMLDQLPIVAKNLLDFALIWCNEEKERL